MTPAASTPVKPVLSRYPAGLCLLRDKPGDAAEIISSSANDCNPDVVCTSSGPAEAPCFNGQDDDCDGLADADATDCQLQASCSV